MSKLHREMRPWREHLKESRLSLKANILPKDIIELVYESMFIDNHEVPLSQEERLEYLRFIYGSILEKSSEWFDKRDINAA